MDHLSHLKQTALGTIVARAARCLGCTCLRVPARAVVIYVRDVRTLERMRSELLIATHRFSSLSVMNMMMLAGWLGIRCKCVGRQWPSTARAGRAVPTELHMRWLPCDSVAIPCYLNLVSTSACACGSRSWIATAVAPSFTPLPPGPAQPLLARPPSLWLTWTSGGQRARR